MTEQQSIDREGRMNSEKLDPLGSVWRSLFVALAATTFGAWTATMPAVAQEPIKIGFGVALTGGLASSGKAHLLSKQIWAEEINAKGGLLGRPVKLFYYDDQTNAATVPAIYAKLMDVDKVDILMGHATNLIVAAMPQIIQRNRMVMVLLALTSNAEFKYPRYFQSAPFGSDTRLLPRNFFEVAKPIKPTPETVALVGADAEFSNNVLRGARESAKAYNLKIVYDRAYPPATVDYSPIVRTIQARAIRHRHFGAHRSAARRGAGARCRQRHVCDRSAWPRRLLRRHALPLRFRPRGRGGGRSSRQRRFDDRDR
jgi:Periplasmic binding protein